MEKRLEMPKTLPGADAPQIRLPALNLEHPEARSEIVEKLFPNRPPEGSSRRRPTWSGARR